MFNSKRYAQGVLDGAVRGLGQAVDEAETLIDPDNQSKTVSTEQATKGLNQEDLATLSDSAQIRSFDAMMAEINKMPEEVRGAIERMKGFQDLNTLIQKVRPSLSGTIQDAKLQGGDIALSQTEDIKILQDSVLSRVRALAATMKKQQVQQELNRQQNLGRQPVISFNLQKYKKFAQNIGPGTGLDQASPDQNVQPQQQEEQTQTRFPVTNEGDFISKFLDDLLGFNGQPGTPEYEKARQASDEIIQHVSPAVQEEANSILESIRQLDPMDRTNGEQNLLKLYEVLLPDAVKNESNAMEPVRMSENNIDGIVRYSLTEQIINNKSASNTEGLIKTAADQFGQQYLLYGPTEKRICPKLRGKNLSVGDVVSEYTCRHHCLDGIVIDDNKTICGEALWRANAMDKFSREYVDEDGEIVGGYLNKRFEINRNVPEENKMRLKPGETRKPRPAAWGNLESRLQDMRAKEGQKRDYRPETNTGDPFEWCHDSDQNNVQVSQKERDRREEASGNKLVQYTNRDQTENKPKIAFNLKKFTKTAQSPGFEQEKYDFASGIARAKEMSTEQLHYAILDLKKTIKIQEEWNRDETQVPPRKLGYYYDELHTYTQELKNRQGQNSNDLNKRLTRQKPTLGFNSKSQKIAKKEIGFNLKKFKEAQFEEEFEEDQVDCPMCGGPGNLLGEMGRLIHYRCRNCGMDFNKPNNPNLPQDNNPLDKFSPMPRSPLNPQAQMTGPRGPIGPDNPQSDDLGLSEDMGGFNDLESDYGKDPQNIYTTMFTPQLYEALFDDQSQTYSTELISTFQQQLKQLETEFQVSIEVKSADNEEIHFKIDRRGPKNEESFNLVDSIDEILTYIESKIPPKYDPETPAWEGANSRLPHHQSHPMPSNKMMNAKPLPDSDFDETDNSVDVGTRVRISGGSGLDSDKTGVVIPWSHPKAREQRNQYPFTGGRSPESMDWLCVLLDSGEATSMPSSRLIPISKKENLPNLANNNFANKKIAKSDFALSAWTNKEKSEKKDKSPKKKS